MKAASVWGFVLILSITSGCAPRAKPAASAAQRAPASTEDPFPWLEEITGDRALAWVREQNTKTKHELEADPRFATMRDRFRKILDSKDRLPHVQKLGALYYNFWVDEAHPRGVWLRATLAELKKPKTTWETVLDLDALAATEKENWVWAGGNCLYPKQERCLIHLSRGGADAQVIREFDTTQRAFVAGGFSLPEGKHEISWQDQDSLFVGSDFGPGSLTDSGYARIVKRWKRGTPITAAKTVYEAQRSDVTASAWRSWDHGKPYDFVDRAITFYENEYYALEQDRMIPMQIPRDAEFDLWDGQLIVKLRSSWKIGTRTFPKGAAVAVPYDKALGRGAPLVAEDATMIFEPSSHRSLAALDGLKSGLIANELEDVRNKLYVWRRAQGRWARTPLIVPSGSVQAGAVEGTDSDDYWLHATDFTAPPSLHLGTLGASSQPLKHSPAFFDAKQLVVEQQFATSKDGTRVPYFIVHRKDLVLDGSHPTLLTGYGGFEISLEPYYSGLEGAGWLERGGVFVQANIRGGGEYGPAWHDAALKHDRQHAYDDFIAIAEALIANKVTSPAHLGIEGGSNGGLLVGVMLTERPDLFGAVVCEAPLLDMKRYHKLPPGASWMGEYGDPDKPEDWAALSKYSPYQNLHRGTHYPRTLFTTSTRDDRAHPGHARKMAARMLAEGDDLLFYENVEGGHAGSANNEETAYHEALVFTFLSRQLGLTP